MADDDDLYAAWRQHLTPDLRAKFERKGRELVESEISVYQKLEKRQAAQVWLAEKREADRKRDSCRFWAIFIVATLTLLAAAAAAIVPFLDAS